MQPPEFLFCFESQRLFGKKNNPLGGGSAAVLAPTEQNDLRYGGVFLRLGNLTVH